MRSKRLIKMAHMKYLVLMKLFLCMISWNRTGWVLTFLQKGWLFGNKNVWNCFAFIIQTKINELIYQNLTSPTVRKFVQISKFMYFSYTFVQKAWYIFSPFYLFFMRLITLLSWFQKIILNRINCLMIKERRWKLSFKV